MSNTRGRCFLTTETAITSESLKEKTDKQLFRLAKNQKTKYFGFLLAKNQKSESLKRTMDEF